MLLMFYDHLEVLLTNGIDNQTLEMQKITQKCIVQLLKFSIRVVLEFTVIFNVCIVY